MRGLALAALGALILLGAEPVLAATMGALGGTLVLLGLAEALSTAGRRKRPARSGTRRGRRIAAAAAGAAGLVVTVAVVIALLATGGAPAPPEAGEITACNGLRLLCDRRLDEVVLPGTHNSMAAADRPGWFFANQIRPVPRQLENGIRLLMIDPHYGVVDSQGRVRTDLRAEARVRAGRPRALPGDAAPWRAAADAARDDRLGPPAGGLRRG